ncbi:MAG: twin-arginine translocase TatA/TatE family subunit [Bacteroidota bacterium]|nr:twin-arginine translocase TatA/TatE family subunit [Bacteroidota bacterium]
MTGILLFFDISSGEILIILVIAFLVFGPSKFPELARKVGKGINEIKRASESIKREINQEAGKIEDSVKVEDKKKPLSPKDQDQLEMPKKKNKATEDSNSDPETK